MLAYVTGAVDQAARCERSALSFVFQHRTGRPTRNPRMVLILVTKPKFWGGPIGAGRAPSQS
jgi:hypothetical protein